MNRDNSYLIGNKFAQGNPPNQTSFKPGVPPWNKGIKGIRNSPKTEFKKGQPSAKRLEIGSLTQRRDKNGRIRNFIKVSDPKTWEEYAKFLWKKTYGRLLSGDVVHHLNGISDDDRIENIIAIPRSDHPRYHNRKGISPIPSEKIMYYMGRYAK